MGGAIDLLREEHGVLGDFLDVLRGIASCLERGELVPETDIDDSLAVLVGFADKGHYVKEEHAILPALRPSHPAQAEKIKQALRGDHMAARQLLSTMRSNAGDAAAGDRSSMKTFAGAGRLYAQLLLAHIQQDADQLFPLVERSFSGGRQKDLMEDLGRVESEELGEGAHDRYVAIVHRLADRYVRTPASVDLLES